MSYSSKRCAFFTVAIVGLGGVAHSQQPPDVVNSDDYFDTASGSFALQNLEAGFDPLGSGNSAFGYGALESDTTGSINTAMGYSALADTTTGSSNVAFGEGSLSDNSTGSRNTAIGNLTLSGNETGSNNIALGYGAGGSKGSFNIAIGINSAENVTGTNNVDIANAGGANDNGIIRIGTYKSQTETFISGIAGSHVTGNAVYVTDTGQLGVRPSAERFKTDVSTIGSISEKLLKLRPVSYHLKSEPNGILQYGLIAEEVDKLFPELVIRDQAGSTQGIRYEELAPMLLTELQRQHSAFQAQSEALQAQSKQNKVQAAQILDLKRQQAEVRAQLAQLDELKHEMRAALRQMKTGADLLAKR